MRRAIVAVGRSLMFLGCAALLLAFGLACVGAGVYLLAAQAMGKPAALLLTGVIAGGCATAFMWLADRKHTG